MAAYTEQATFKVIDQASGPVKAITAALTALDKSAKQLAKGYNLGASLRGLDSATKNLTSSTREIDKLTRSFDKLGKLNLNLSGQTNQITSMADAMRRLNAEVVRSDRLRGAARGMVGGSGGGVVQTTAAADRFERWMRARESRMVHNDARFLGRHAAAAMGIDYHAAASGVHAAEMFPRRPGLVAGVIGGAATIAGAKTTMEVAGSRDLTLKQLKALGYDKEIDMHGHNVNGMKAAKEEAHAISRRYLNVSETEALDMIKEGTSLFGDQAHAIEGMKHLARMTSFLNTYMGEHGGGDFRREAFSAVKSAEIAGKITPQEMNKYMGSMAAMKIIYGEQANFQTFLAAQRAAGIAGMGLSDEYRFGIMPAMVQEFGPGAGVMLATAFRHAHGNKKFTKKELAKMNEFGVFDAKNDAATYKDQFDKNPFEAALEMGNRIAAKKKMAPLIKDGVLNKETHEQVKPMLADIIGRMLGDRNAAKQMVEQLFQAPKLIKDAKLYAAVMKDMENIEKGDFFNMRTMPGMQTALQKQWENFLSKLGEDMSSPLIATGNKVASMMNKASDLPASVKVGGMAVGAVGAAYAGKKAMEWITGSGQMKIAANSLLRAGAALNAAAARLGIGGAAGAAGSLPGGAKPGKLGRIMKGGGLIGLAALTGYEIYDLLPEEVKNQVKSVLTPGSKPPGERDNTDHFASSPEAGWLPKKIEDGLARMNNPTMHVGPGEGEEFRRFMDMDHNLDHLTNRTQAEEAGKVVAASFGKSSPKAAKVFTDVFGSDVGDAGTRFTRAFRDGAPLAGEEFSSAFGTGTKAVSNELAEAVASGGEAAGAATGSAIADGGAAIAGSMSSALTDGAVSAADILIGGISSGADQAAGSLSAGIIGGGAEASGLMQSSISAAAGLLQSSLAAGGEQAAASIAAVLASGVSVNVNPGKAPDVGSNGLHY